MADLHPAPFGDLVKRMFLEFERQRTIFDLPSRKFYRPNPKLDTRVRFHGQLAANPLGPASGPQTQMAQNLVLSWLGGSRILELKTVQIDDELVINRPCIDATNVGYNIEFSQELRVTESAYEYVGGMMLIEMLKASNLLGFEPSNFDKTATIYDMSLGYDLAGISSPKVRKFIDAMQDATEIIDKLRQQIPPQWKQFRDLDYPKRICNSVTLSTFHNCPPNEIEKICMFLLTEIGVHTTVKMNPTMLGKDELDYILHEKLGYNDIKVNPKALTSGLSFDESIEMCARLSKVAEKNGLGFGAKFSNTLEVINHRTFFPKDQIMYMSGAPLHVVTMRLVERFRQNFSPTLPISFSAGVDKHNFADAVSCGYVPITTCTDLLKPGGYGRLCEYLQNLEKKMTEIGVSNIPDFILKAHGNAQKAEELAQKRGVPAEKLRDETVKMAAFLNLEVVNAKLINDERYTFAKNSAVPKRINSNLWMYDCISCDKCIPVCPNDANFYYEIEPFELKYNNFRWSKGKFEPVEGGVLKVEKKHQIANFADFCNECGNCDTFCPEYGGPFIQKPSFFENREKWLDGSHRDGFYIAKAGNFFEIVGRIKGKTYELRETAGGFSFSDGVVNAEFTKDHALVSAKSAKKIQDGHVLDMNTYHTMRTLLKGLLNPSRVHQVNTPFL
jgi:putative selenate reductase